MKNRAYKNIAATETINVNDVSKPINERGKELDVPRGTIFGGTTKKVERLNKTTPIVDTAFYKWLEAEKNEGRVYTDVHFAIRRFLGGSTLRSTVQQERHKQVYLFFKLVIKTTLG